MPTSSRALLSPRRICGTQAMYIPMLVKMSTQFLEQFWLSLKVGALPVCLWMHCVMPWRRGWDLVGMDSERGDMKSVILPRIWPSNGAGRRPAVLTSAPAMSKTIAREGCADQPGQLLRASTVAFLRSALSERQDLFSLAVVPPTWLVWVLPRKRVLMHHLWKYLSVQLMRQRR